MTKILRTIQITAIIFLIFSLVNILFTFQIAVSPAPWLAKQLSFPILWGDLGTKLVSSAVIDEQKLRALYQGRDGVPEEMEKMLFTSNVKKIRITAENAPILLNVFWALALGNKNPILEKGEMVDTRYGGAGNFASTAGWTLASGHPMDHYSRHEFFQLSSEQQDRVDRVSKNIYRPCCPNSAHFPDCNHGMAMLGLHELMARQNASPSDMYKTANILNSYWFPPIKAGQSGGCNV